MICGNLRHQWPQDSSFSTLPNFVFYARTLRGPRRALLPPGLGVTKLKLWSVWKVYWACPWVLGMTEYIDSLYGDHRDRSDHGSNNWWWWAGWILTRWWPAKRKCEIWGFNCHVTGLPRCIIPSPKLHIWKQPQCLSACITATNVNTLKCIFLGVIAPLPQTSWSKRQNTQFFWSLGAPYPPNLKHPRGLNIIQLLKYFRLFQAFLVKLYMVWVQVKSKWSKQIQNSNTVL